MGSVSGRVGVTRVAILYVLCAQGRSGRKVRRGTGLPYEPPVQPPAPAPGPGDLFPVGEGAPGRSFCRPSGTWRLTPAPREVGPPGSGRTSDVRRPQGTRLSVTLPVTLRPDASRHRTRRGLSLMYLRRDSRSPGTSLVEPSLLRPLVPDLRALDSG